jgi:hypothetical protein
MMHRDPNAPQLSASESLFCGQILSSYRFRRINLDHPLRKSLSRANLAFRSVIFFNPDRSKKYPATSGKQIFRSPSLQSGLRSKRQSVVAAEAAGSRRGVLRGAEAPLFHAEVEHRFRLRFFPRLLVGGGGFAVHWEFGHWR